MSLYFMLNLSFLCLCSSSTNYHKNDNRISSEQLPLFVKDRYIVDKNGARVKLGCVSWYGAEELDFVVGGMEWQLLSEIVSIIPKYGFNCVRLLWSLELVKSNPIISNATLLKKQPSFINKSAMYIFDQVVSALTDANVMVILDNHVSDSGWCCSSTDGNGLWYTDNYPAEEWMDLWQQMAERYVNNYYVIGVDLRNELRESKVNNRTLIPTWGDNIDATDWRKAAIQVTKLIQAKNPNLLIIVEGIYYAQDLRGVRNHPILDSDLLIGNKLLYEAHNYEWFQEDNSYYVLERSINVKWGFVFQGNNSFTAPVWLGEFGTCHHNTDGCLNGTWWKSITKYLYDYDIPWAFWDYPGTCSTAQGRTYGSVDSWGLLNANWSDVYNINQIHDLQKIQKPRLK